MSLPFAAKTTGLLFLLDTYRDLPPTVLDMVAFYSLTFGSKVDKTDTGEEQTQSPDKTHSQVTSVHSHGSEIPHQAQLTTFFEKIKIKIKYRSILGTVSLNGSWRSQGFSMNLGHLGTHRG